VTIEVIQSQKPTSEQGQSEQSVANALSSFLLVFGCLALCRAAVPPSRALIRIFEPLAPLTVVASGALRVLLGRRIHVLHGVRHA
jgi:hypothetical protein